LKWYRLAERKLQRKIFENVTPEVSRRLSAVRNRGNRSTEQVVRFRLVRAGLKGWTLHDKTVPGTPDFLFGKYRIAIFVDGCFWHGCAHCRAVNHKKNVGYWTTKIAGNRQRDQRTTSLLRSRGYIVIRIWEHGVRSNFWMKRLEKIVKSHNQG